MRVSVDTPRSRRFSRDGNGACAPIGTGVPSTSIVVAGKDVWVPFARYKATAQYEDMQIDRITVSSTVGGDNADFTSIGVATGGAVKASNVLSAGATGSVYVDLLGNVLDERVETRRRAESGDTYGAYDAISAIGMSTEMSRREFLAMMKALKDRVREKQRQDGVRPL